MQGQTRLLALAGIVLLSGCSMFRSAEPAGETISVSVGPCFGACPVYTVTMAPTGEVTFDGIRHTEAVGTRRASSPDGYRRAALALARYRPAMGTAEATDCDDHIADLPRYTIIWTAPDGRTATLTHDRGCLSRANRRLNETLETLPDVLGISRWTRRVAGRAPDGDLPRPRRTASSR